ncbi:hypothetical protein AU255_09370 [Methyloprofundus sedimenti]|uniref:Uncharacterized protein n=1 Tax=Methyloprofundus sedimenti TaxID=1420851 RepID=A0A1V8M8W3_9GAMM|nr:hypothetical protein [Methyloprofundus sedimenti]OQK18044.1 hypothetical protein AU255_09370 [Methyloprofundus sedimenti]
MNAKLLPDGSDSELPAFIYRNKETREAGGTMPSVLVIRSILTFHQFHCLEKYDKIPINLI